jgi:hypothetical protein
MNRISLNYPDADKIHLVLDNLNTHVLKSLIDFYGEIKGRQIWNRFVVHYTPKHASWLNQAEIQIGMCSKMCLDKRKISNIDALRFQINSWKKYVNKKQIKIQWQFTTIQARVKLKYKKG